MPIRFDVVMFPDPADQKLYEERKEFWTTKLPTLPSHQEWFDPEAFEWIIDELAIAEIELLIFNRRIQEDPLTFGKLDKIRNNTRQAVHKYRMQLAIDGKKMKDLMPKRKKPSNLVDALSDEDYIA